MMSTFVLPGAQTIGLVSGSGASPSSAFFRTGAVLRRRRRWPALRACAGACTEPVDRPPVRCSP